MMKLINNLSKKFDSSKSFKFADLDPFSETSAWISTGIPSLDYRLETLGIPPGIIELRGKSQSGKTSLSLQFMKSCQEQYGDRAVVSILSSERRDNKPYAKVLGVDIGNVLVHRVVTIEDVFNKIHQTIEKTEETLKEAFREDVKATTDIKVSQKEKFDLEVAERLKKFGKPRFLFVWDSLGNTISAQEKLKMSERAKKDEEGQAAMASAARAISTGFRSIVGLIDEYDVTLLVINRAYEKIGTVPGKQSYGGQGIELFPTMRLEISRKMGVKIGEEEVGQICQIEVIKSDFQQPKGKFEIELKYGTGFVLCSEDIEKGIEFGLLDKHGVGGAKSKNGKVAWTSRKQLYQLYDDRSPFLKLLIRKMNKEFNDQTLMDKRAAK